MGWDATYRCLQMDPWDTTHTPPFLRKGKCVGHRTAILEGLAWASGWPGLGQFSLSGYRHQTGGRGSYPGHLLLCAVPLPAMSACNCQGAARKRIRLIRICMRAHLQA